MRTKTFRPYDQDSFLLMPPSVRDWVDPDGRSAASSRLRWRSHTAGSWAWAGDCVRHCLVAGAPRGTAIPSCAALPAQGPAGRHRCARV